MVLDPNVLGSAAISSQGPSARLVGEARLHKFELMACPMLLVELGRVLARQRFRRYLSVEEAIRYVEGIGSLATGKADPQYISPATRDPSDDYLVAFLNMSADLLVSGDSDLTDLEDDRIVTPRVAIEILESVGR